MIESPAAVWFRRLRSEFARGRFTVVECVEFDVVRSGAATQKELERLFPDTDWSRFRPLRKALGVIRGSGLPAARAAEEMRLVISRFQRDGHDKPGASSGGNGMAEGAI